MNHPQDGLPTANPAAPALRDVHRAIAALRRGTPVRMVTQSDRTIILLSAETAEVDGILALKALSLEPPILLVAPARAASLRGHAVGAHLPARKNQPNCRAEALELPPELLTPTALHSLADPTLPQLPPPPAWLSAGPEAVAPPADPGSTGHAAAIALAKLGRLLPAVLAAPAKTAIGASAVLASDILAYPAAASAALVRVAEAMVPLEDAPDARVVAFRAPETGIEHLAIVIGQPHLREAPLVRIHSECFTGDLLGSLRCDCGPQLRAAIRRIAEDGGGVLLYLSQEGRGIGLVNKLRAYALQDRGLDTYDANGELGWGADERDYLAAATMLETLGISRLRLLTNNPDKLAALIACGVEVAGRESHFIPPNGVNDRYMAAKLSRFGHLFPP